MVKKDEKKELISLLVGDAAWIMANHQENKETRIQVAVGIVNVKAVGLLTQEVPLVKWGITVLTQEAVGIVHAKVIGLLLSQKDPLTKWGITVLKVHLRTVFLTSLVVLVVTDQAISEDQEW